jgi:NAD(P)H dehydrogenase (quinone)
MRIAVTGANGRIGGQVVDLLAADGKHEVVAVSRRETNAVRAHVTNAIADYEDVAALRAGLRDVDTLILVSSDGEATKVLVHHQNVIRAAADSGVGHIVALSGLDADLASPFCYAVTYGYTERLLADIPCTISVARASIYTEFFMTWLIQARTSGQLRLPAGSGRISLVSRSDVARCLAALASAAPTGRDHEITGPEALDGHAIAAIAQEEWNTQIDYVDLPPAEYRAEIARAGEDAWWEYAYSTMFDSVREQRWEAVTEDVFKLTERAPTPVRELLSQLESTTPP